LGALANYARGGDVTRNIVMFRDDLTYVDPERTDPKLIEGLELGKPFRTTGDKPLGALGSVESTSAPKVASDFSGIRTLEAGLGGEHVTTHAAEIDSTITDAANVAHGTKFKPKDVHDVDPEDLAGADLYHASPVCKSLSGANVTRQVSETDIGFADKIASNIREAMPPSVSIENVPEFASKPELMNPIASALDEAGYTWDVQIHNAADYGGAMNRDRMVIRAVKDGELPPLPEQSEPGDWFEVVSDLVDDAPDSTPRGKQAGKANREFSQIEEREKRFIDTGGRSGLDPTKPIITMGHSRNPNYPYAANSGGPAPTLASSPGAVPRIIMPDGRVKKVTGRMMARLMGLPDGFKVPDDWKLAKTTLGNGIHGETTRNFIEPLLKRHTARDTTKKLGALAQ